MEVTRTSERQASCIMGCFIPGQVVDLEKGLGPGALPKGSQGPAGPHTPQPHLTLHPKQTCRCLSYRPAGVI